METVINRTKCNIRAFRLRAAIRVMLSVLFLNSSAVSAAVAQGGLYTSDIPKRFPAAYANWKRTLPYAVHLDDWLVELDGVVSPIRDITMKGAQLKFGTVCLPHDCGSNIAGILFTPDQDRVIALVRLNGLNGAPTIMLIGEMSAFEKSCLQRLIDNYDLKAC